MPDARLARARRSLPEDYVYQTPNERDWAAGRLERLNRLLNEEIALSPSFPAVVHRSGADIRRHQHRHHWLRDIRAGMWRCECGATGRSESDIANAGQEGR